MAQTAAFMLGRQAKASGFDLGNNPYHPDDEIDKYEDWVDGWVEEQNEQLDYQSLFTS